MTRAAFQALLSHWRRRPLQLVTLVLGLALATALWSGVQAINAEARASYDEAAEALGGGALDTLVAADGGTIPVETFVALRRAGWAVAPVVEGWIAGDGGRVRLLGLDPLTAPPGTAAAGAALGDDPLAFFGSNGVLLAAPATADRLAANGLPVTAVEGLAPGMAFADIPVAQRLLGVDGLTRLVILEEQPLVRPALDTLAPGLDRRAPEAQADLARLTDSFHLNLTAFGLLSFAVGLFIVHGAVALAFEQRRPVFRTLRALGLSARRLTALVALELLAFALIAGAIGVGLGYVIAAALLPGVAATLRGIYGATVEGSLTLQPAWWAAGFAIAVAGTAVAAAGSLWKLSRLPVLAPARPRAWAMASGAARRAQLGAAGGLALLALGAGLSGGGLVAGFVMLGALLVAAALALPTVLDLALGACARLGGTGPKAQWFWADTRQQLPGLSLALMALLLALAANIGVGTMVSSFRLTFTGWLDQRLASELYVAAETPEQAEAMLAFLGPMTDAILPIWNVEGTVEGAPAEIFGVADHATYRENWPMLDALPGVWDRVAAGGAVLVNEQLARREGLAPGDAVSLPDGWTPVVGGIYSDYGNPMAQVLIALPELAARFPGVEKLDFGLRVPPGRVDEVRQALLGFGIPDEKMIDQAALKAFSLEVFERTFAVSAALNVLTLSIAGFAILTSLLTLAAMRLPQLAPVWALGLTRAELSRLEVLRALLLAVLTFVAAVPVGLLLAWVLLAVINVEAFGWRLPMFLFPRDWVWLGLLSLLAAGLASLWPALRLSRMAPARLIAVFAHER
ncbi:FtsX-like permease family protein [Palleronia sp. KMU-117]|uniref:FtsX-like permease family protein n=1 Tax=Palleronia sp. KMU-117 TaxID=3434108 RepID=UPI003D708B62